MGKLNEKNEFTEKIIHILITSLCARKCKYCCNNQYSLDDIETVTDEELHNAHTLCLTGGEPFLFSNPCEIAKYYKTRYRNIKKIYVYRNAIELGQFLSNNKTENLFEYIDGLDVSIKTKADKEVFSKTVIKDHRVTKMTCNQLYVFDGLMPDNTDGFNVFNREWQSDFEPANDSIFRRL